MGEWLVEPIETRRIQSEFVWRGDIVNARRFTLMSMEMVRFIGAPQDTANLGFDIQLMKHLTFSPSLEYFTEQAAADTIPGRKRPMTSRFVTVSM